VVAARPPRGEYTLVVAGAPPPEAPVWNESERLAAASSRTRDLVESGRTRSEAARAAAAEHGVARRAVYQGLLGAPDGDDEE
jgi:16S rRNA (cytidine1402-2'-O)-methyltransferase